jgi:hypothetical protein
MWPFSSKKKPEVTYDGARSILSRVQVLSPHDTATKLGIPLPRKWRVPGIPFTLKQLDFISEQVLPGVLFTPCATFEQLLEAHSRRFALLEDVRTRGMSENAMPQPRNRLVAWTDMDNFSDCVGRMNEAGLQWGRVDLATGLAALLSCEMSIEGLQFCLPLETGGEVIGLSSDYPVIRAQWYRSTDSLRNMRMFEICADSNPQQQVKIEPVFSRVEEGVPA